MVLERLRSALGRKRAGPSERRPRLLGLSMVKNEQDIIEPFLRHNAPLLDAIVLLDNASLDRTREIALACARELGTIVVGDSPDFSFLQSERMSALLQDAQAAFRADYVLMLDADEFLSAPDRTTLEAALRPIPPGGTGLVPWRTFVIRPGQETMDDPPGSFTHRRRTEQPAYSKAVLRLDGELASGLVVEQGSHGVLDHDGRLPSVPLEGLQLLHFPVRSTRQITAKAIVGWTACVARDPAARGHNLCYQWRDAFDLLTAGGQDAIAAQLAATSFAYAQDQSATNWDADTVPETPPTPPRTHSDGSFADPLALVALSWERSLSPATASDDVASLRFIAEKHRPGRVLHLGGAAGEALWAALGTPVVPATWSEAGQIEGAFDLAVSDELDQAALDSFNGLACYRIITHTGPDGLQHWIRRGWSVDEMDTMGARALSPQQLDVVVLVRDRPAPGRA